jgi:beta-N-acetylhexosaminidase
MLAPRRRILLRRTVAVLAAAGATAATAVLLSGAEEESRPGAPRGAAGVPAKVQDLLGRLSTEQKVDQVLALGFAGTDATSPVVAKLRGRQLGAVFVGSANWLDAAQGAALVGELRAAAEQGGPIPPLVLARQEGGDYRSFADLPPAQTELQIGDSGDPRAAQTWSAQTSRALRDAGFDLNLFPIADVATLDSPVADRAFGEESDLVARMTVAAMIGCRDAGIGCAPASFPGLGAASQDTDLGPATVGQNAATLLRRDLTPFRAAIAAGAPAVVVSHAFYAAFDPVTPASQARSIVTGLLRRRIGFGGVAITDDLDTGAVKALGSVRDAAVASLAAGADLLLIESPGETQEVVRSALLAATRNGEVSEPRLDEAAGRVLELKRRLGLVAGAP